jgi:PPOX class probable F420-dependent enzyme
MEPIPENFEALFDEKSYGVIATLLPDGNPHLTVVWVDYDGEHVLINTAEGRRKTRNVRRDPRVGLLVIDPDDWFRYVSILGEVTEITEEGAIDHIDSLGQRYKGEEAWSDRYDDDVVRVILKITPERLFTREPYGIEK